MYEIPPLTREQFDRAFGEGFVGFVFRSTPVEPEEPVVAGGSSDSDDEQ